MALIIGTLTKKSPKRKLKNRELRYVQCPCGKTFATTHHSTRWHSDQCRKSLYKRMRSENFTNRKRRETLYSTVGSHTRDEWITKLKLSGYLCFWCGKEMHEGDATKDHLQPLSRGGTSYITNIQPACRSCNSRKGSKTAEEFRGVLDRQKSLELGISTNERAL